ncbi:MAG TPA: thioredoxin-disulfide reductase [Candidatus Latescibacteria bacterium]|nr:thioredoxin-disulfide reductase [Candidatus Latescibacterota bacterium]
MKRAEFDVIIVGAGPAGLTAGIYVARAGLNAVLYEKLSPGGQAATTDLVENYPGFDRGISGLELMEKMESQARRFGLRIEFKPVDRVYSSDGLHFVRTADGEDNSARAVIVATGAEPNPLGVPGEDALRGRGVSYCATCDGPLYRSGKVAVVGGGDSAVGEAIFLTRFASKVYLVHRRHQLRATKSLQDKALSNDKVEFIWDSVVTRIEGEDSVNSISIRNVRSAKERKLKVDGVFIYVGRKPNSAILDTEVRSDQKGYIITNEHMETSVKGLFAAGDVRSKLLYQIATAVGDGATAAYAVEKSIAG